MRNPLQRLKYLPWLILLQVAAIATAIATVLDALFVLGLGLAPVLFNGLAPVMPCCFRCCYLRQPWGWVLWPFSS
ncbi:MAG: hypothetical protein HC873_19745 [Leptolyngbyaceae cyanobacterium SL_1_1]|nr:hypothetical protein [Leptolyngbyaceae cyanobacterium SL_1_1]